MTSLRNLIFGRLAIGYGAMFKISLVYLGIELLMLVVKI